MMMKKPTQNQIDTLKMITRKLYNLSTELIGISIELCDNNDCSEQDASNPLMDIHSEIDALSFKLADILAYAS